MNEFNEIDHELQAAFTQRPTALSRPSLHDVKQRARRHQRQRSAGVLGACALVGVGGVAALAQRSPTSQTAVGEGEGDPSSTICFPTVSTFIMYDTSTVPMPGTVNTLPPFYVVKTGDNPTVVALQHSVTLEALNSANLNTPGYDTFYVGLEIVIPRQIGVIPTTTMNTDESILTYYVLQEGDFPKAVADAFGVTVSDLDAANLETEGYDGWLVGTAIRIPFPIPASTTTTGPVDPFDPNPVSFPNCLSVSDSTILGIDTTLPSETTTTSISLTPTTFTFTKIGTSIQVVNCSNQEGVAGYMSYALAAEGFAMAEADTGTIDLPMTKVIYNPDDPAALAVAQSVAILLGNAAVEPSGPEVPALTHGTWAPGSAVMVLLGDDLAGKTLAQIAAQTYTGGTVPETTWTTP